VGAQYGILGQVSGKIAGTEPEANPIALELAGLQSDDAKGILACSAAMSDEHLSIRLAPLPGLIQ
jgi:hypothetical protein